MEVKYLCNKKGSISSTLSWAVATLIVVILLIIYLFVIPFLKSNSILTMDHKKFLSNSFEREFYTFLEDDIVFEGKETSLKELSKLIVLPSDERRISADKRSKISDEGLAARNFSLNFTKGQSNLIDYEKTGISYDISIKIENFITDESGSAQEKKYPFYLVYDKMLLFIYDESVLNEIHFETISYCKLEYKDTLFREAFISKDRKITYCFTY